MNLALFISPFNEPGIEPLVNKPPTGTSTAIGPVRSEVHEVFISPLPFPELRPLMDKLHGAIRPYQVAHSRYTKEHPLLPDQDAREYYTNVDITIRKKYKEGTDLFDSIRKQLMDEKQRIFDAVAPILEGTIIRLYGISHLQQGVNNYKVASKAISGKSGLSEIISRLEEYKDRLEELIGEYSQSPSDGPLLNTIEETAQAFFERINTPLRDHFGITLKEGLNFEYFYGRMGGSYVWSFEEFKEHFLYHTTPNPKGSKFYYAGRAEVVGVKLFGILNGDFLLSNTIRAWFKGFPPITEFQYADLFLPVQLRTSCSPQYSRYLDNVFAQIKNDFPGRIIDPSQLDLSPPV